MIDRGCVRIRDSTIGKGICGREARCKLQTDSGKVCDSEANVWREECERNKRGKRRCRMVVLLSKPLLVLVLIQEACGEK